MSNGVQFDIDNEPRAGEQTKTPAMVKLVTKLSMGLIKDERQANYVLLGFAITAFVISFLLFSGGTVNTPPSGIPMPQIVPAL